MMEGVYMPTPTVTKRIGFSRLVQLVKLLCALYKVYSAKINAWVSDEIAEPQRSQVLAWLALIQTICTILESTPLP